AAGLCVPARLHRCTRPRRIDGGERSRRSDGAARLSPCGDAAWLSRLLSQCDGRPAPRMALQERPRTRLADGALAELAHPDISKTDGRAGIVMRLQLDGCAIVLPVGRL